MMSGGSFDYLCYKGAEHWIGQECSRSAEEMIDALIAAGAEDAARETRAVISIVDSARVRIEALIGRMMPVWHAIEWWKSGDSGEDDFKKALAKWRGEDKS